MRSLESRAKSIQGEIDHLSAISKNIGLGVEQSEMVTSLISDQKSALDAFRAMHWNPDGISGEIAGHSFQNSEEFFKFLNETDARMKLPIHAAEHLREDFWLKIRLIQH